MEKMFCANCGSELYVDFVTPTKSFCIDEDGKINRIDNNEDELPYFKVYCSNIEDKCICCYPTTDPEEQKKYYENILKFKKSIMEYLKIQETLNY